MGIARNPLTNGYVTLIMAYMRFGLSLSAYKETDMAVTTIDTRADAIMTTEFVIPLDDPTLVAIKCPYVYHCLHDLYRRYLPEGVYVFDDSILASFDIWRGLRHEFSQVATSTRFRDGPGKWFCATFTIDNVLAGGTPYVDPLPLREDLITPENRDTYFLQARRGSPLEKPQTRFRNL